MNAVLSELISRLTVGDIAEQMGCLDEILANFDSGGELPEFLKGALISCLTTCEFPEFAAERMARVANQLTSELQLLLNSDSSSEAKFWAALLLLHVNVRSGVPFLLRVIEAKDNSWYLLATVRLAQANEVAAIPIILRALQELTKIPEELNIKDIDVIVSLLSALKYFNEPNPPDLLRKFSSDNAPWQIKYALGLPVDIAKTFGARKSGQKGSI